MRVLLGRNSSSLPQGWNGRGLRIRAGRVPILHVRNRKVTVVQAAAARL